MSGNVFPLCRDRMHVHFAGSILGEHNPSSQHLSPNLLLHCRQIYYHPLNDISQLFSGFVGIKVHFDDPYYVTGCLCLQTFDTDKLMVAAAASWARIGRQCLINHIICHDAIWLLEAALDHDLDISGKVADLQSPDAAPTIMEAWPHTYFSQKEQTSKRCRLWPCTWGFPSGCCQDDFYSVKE